MVSGRLGVKVVPGASHTALAGWLGADLKVRVAKPPKKGKANRELEALLGESLGLAAGSVRVIRGHTSARKLIEVDGLSDAVVRQRLNAHLGTST